MPNEPIRLSQAVRAGHLIWTGYGHWLPNDPRGSGSTVVRSEGLAELGPVHHGRKPVQPPRRELRRFMRDAEGRLLHPVVWFDDGQRAAIGKAVLEVARADGFTVYALAVLRNHVHAVVRTHRDAFDVVLGKIATASREALRTTDAMKDHPVWSARMYQVFLRSDSDIRGRIT